MSASVSGPYLAVLTAADLARLDSTVGAFVTAAARRGVATLIIEANDLPAGLLAAAEAADVSVLAAVTCFHEHPGLSLQARPDLWPIDHRGIRRPRMEWYTGVTPTTPDVADEIVIRAGRLARTEGVSGVVLDFIRWPLHWELECRPGAREPLWYSFDPATIHAFAAWIGVDLDPTDPQAAFAQARRRPHDWVDFRCGVITEVIARVAATTAAAGGTVGAFVVPLPHRDRRALVGQDVEAWTGLVDVIYPMAYHAILHRRVPWITTVLEDLENCTDIRVVPVVQLTSASVDAAGADWGTPISAGEARYAVRLARESAGRVALFPGTAAVTRLPLAGAALLGAHVL